MQQVRPQFNRWTQGAYIKTLYYMAQFEYNRTSTLWCLAQVRGNAVALVGTVLSRTALSLDEADYEEKCVRVSLGRS